MSRPNSFNSKSNRARRKAVAEENKMKPLMLHRDCGMTHRVGRECRSNAEAPAAQAIKEALAKDPDHMTVEEQLYFSPSV